MVSAPLPPAYRRVVSAPLPPVHRRVVSALLPPAAPPRGLISLGRKLELGQVSVE